MILTYDNSQWWKTLKAGAPCRARGGIAVHRGSAARKKTSPDTPGPTFPTEIYRELEARATPLLRTQRSPPRDGVIVPWPYVASWNDHAPFGEPHTSSKKWYFGLLRIRRDDKRTNAPSSGTSDTSSPPQANHFDTSTHQVDERAMISVSTSARSGPVPTASNPWVGAASASAPVTHLRTWLGGEWNSCTH